MLRREIEISKAVDSQTHVLATRRSVSTMMGDQMEILTFVCFFLFIRFIAQLR